MPELLICPRCHRRSIEMGRCLWKECGWYIEASEELPRKEYNEDFESHVSLVERGLVFQAGKWWSSREGE